MDNFTKQGIILAGCVFGLLLVFLVFQSQDTTVMDSSGIAVDGTTAVNNEDGTSSPTAAENIDPQKWIVADLKPGVPNLLDLGLRDAPKELGAFALKLSDDGGMINVNVHVRSTGRCMYGDLDIIKQELNLDRNAPFLLSLEPLDGNTADFGDTYAVKIDPIALDGGPTYTLRIPIGAEPEHLGLFICRDASNSGSCAKKPVVDPSAVMDQHLLAEPGASDKIYYFQYLLMQNNTLTLFNPELEETGKLEKYLVERTRNGPSASFATSSFQRLNETIDSLPAVLKMHTIEIDLPHLSKGKCGPPKRLSIEEFKRLHGSGKK